MSLHPLIEAKKAEFAAITDHFRKELGTVRTGRATPMLVEHVLIEAYGVKTPLTQLASLSVPDPKTLFVQPWDKNILKEIERALTAASLGVAPIVEGDRVRLTLPPMTEETRKQLSKIVREKLETSRASLRRLRDQIREHIITGERAKAFSEDERYRAQRELDDYTKSIQDQLVQLAESKGKEIMTV